MRKIINFFATEHLIGNLITFFIIAAGVFSIHSLRRDIFPTVDYGFTVVSTALPGASPDQIEKLIINTIENKLKEVNGIEEVRSVGTESLAKIFIKLDTDSRSPEKTNADIKTAMDQINDFPENTEKPVITTVESGLIPVIQASLSGDLDKFELQRISKELSEELEEIKQVSSIQKYGYKETEFLVNVDPTQLKRKNLSINRVISKIQQTNVALPAGKIILPDGNEQLIRTDGQLTDIKSIKDVQLTNNLDGIGTKLSEVATVAPTLETINRVYKFEGQPTVILQATKKKQADALKLVDKIKAKASAFQARYGDKIKVNLSRDMSTYLRHRLSALTGNLLIGLLLVIIVLSLFLPWQVTLVVSVGVPVALFATFTTAYLLGFSINLISLLGLIIVLGMLVDDAIVVSENIWRHYEKGGNQIEAIKDGIMEVIGPVTASILTTVSAFAPMLFMTGVFGAFVFEIPLMVILALAFSLLEAMLIMPSHFSNWVSPPKVNVENKKSWFDPILNTYIKYVRWSLAHRYLMSAAAIALFTATVFMVMTFGKFKLFTSEGINFFFVKVVGPPSISLEAMAEKISPIENKIASFPKNKIKDFITTVGVIENDALDPLKRYGNQFVNIQVNISDDKPMDISVNEIMVELEDSINAMGLPPGIVSIKASLPPQGPPQGRDISFDITGKDFSVLNEILEKTKVIFQQSKLVKNIEDSNVDGKVEWNVIPNNPKMSSLGVSTGQLSQALRASYEGIVATSIKSIGEETNVRVKMDRGGLWQQKKRKNSRILSQNLSESSTEKAIRNEIGDLGIENRRLSLSKVKSLSKLKKINSRSIIQHLNRKRVVTVAADSIDPEDTSTANNYIKPKIEALLKEYPGYTIVTGGAAKDTKESMDSLKVAFAFAFFFIFCLLVITFRSLLQPLLILVCIPLGFVGTVFAMMAHGRSFGFLSMLGAIALAGVIVNNSIVFTDFVNKCRKEGAELSQSIIEAAKKRLRPIVLTTITTVCGLMPTAYGDLMRSLTGFGGADPFIVPIALALGWGLFIGSILTLVFFPCFIRVVDDIRGLFSRKKTTTVS